MISFKPVVFRHHFRQDGSCNVKIRVTYKGKSRMLPTSIFITKAEVTRAMKIKPCWQLSKANSLCDDMRRVAADLPMASLPDKDVDFVVAFIRQRLSDDSFRLPFVQFCRDFAASKSSTTSKSYATLVNSFARFLPGGEVDINQVTRSMMTEFICWYQQQPSLCNRDKLGNSGFINNIIQFLSSAHKHAKSIYNDEDTGRVLIPRSPFEGLKIPKKIPHGQKSVGQELMQRVILHKESGPTGTALDAFVISFLLMGANMADLYGAKAAKVWVYNRHKTRTRRADKSEMRVDVPPHVAVYAKRYGPSKLLCPQASHCNSVNNSSRRFNELYEAWCRKNGIDKFTFYAARHTWATLARSIGIEKSTIDECLGHVGDFAITDIYAERNWKLINEANRKVLALFQWPEK